MDDVLCNNKVTCSGCGREYDCSLEDDYFDATDNNDGVCSKCFQAQNNTPSIDDIPPDAPAS